MLNKKSRKPKSLIIIISIILLTIFAACSSNTIEFTKWELVTDSQSFPEGITWSTDHILYSSNCNGNWITRITPTQIDTFLIASDSTFGKTNGMLAYKDGDILACDYEAGTILKFERNGKREIIIDGYNGEKFNRPNDLTLDKNGILFFSDPKSHGQDILDGRIFSYNFVDKKLSLLDDSLAFPNGIGISHIDNRLYVCESAKSRILRYDLDEANNVSNKTVFIELPGGDPDGFNFDIYGNMYVAHYGSGTMYIISPEAEIIHSIKTPGVKPSNVEFADEDLRTLYLTEDETNSIYKMRLNVSGFSVK